MKRAERAQRMALPEQTVEGERGMPTIARALSRQARLSNRLAVGLIAAVGGGLLVSYYTHTFKRQQAHPVRAAQTQAAGQSADDASLPPLRGLLSRPPVRHMPVAPVEASPAAQKLGVAALPVAGVDERLPSPPPALYPVQAASTASASVSVPSDLQRRMGGQPFVSAQGMQAASPASNSITELSGPSGVQTADHSPEPTQPPPIRITWHQPQLGTSPYVLSDPSLLLPKGASIDCTLETAIDSTLPGMTSCITPTDTFGADGRVVLMERGTRLIGETEGQVQQGSARVFVLWTEARTPLGVMIPLQSPGADELGRAGLPGNVQRHFWERFGAAIMISILNGAVQAAVNSSSSNGGTVIYQPGASQDVMTEVLKSTVNIPPTVIKRNGDRIQVLVAQDVDFQPVYLLQHATH